MLILASSHGAGLKETMESMFAQVRVYSSYQRGGKIADIYRMVEQRLSSMKRHNSDYIILHIGHNSVAFHGLKNEYPEHDFTVTDEVLDLVHWLEVRFPGVPVFYSTMFPRVPYKQFDKALCGGYNRMVVRQARYAKRIGLKTIVSMGLFESYQPPQPNTRCFSDRDGLHLTEYGQQIVCSAWMGHLSAYALKTHKVFISNNKIIIYYYT